jgi:serine/threonine-protein phosphatase 2A regulatory subunit B''
VTLAGTVQEVDEQCELRRKEDELRETARNATLKSIPRFYKKRLPGMESSAQQRLRRDARQRFLLEMTDELLDESELRKIQLLLLQHIKDRNGDVEVIDYDGFCQVRDNLDARFAPHFTADTFLKFDRDESGCIAVWLFFSYVVRKVNIKQTRVQLSYYDTHGRGYLREKDMENFVFELIPTLPQLQSLQEEFYPFYVFTAVRKFFFFLDPMKKGRIDIRSLLTSPILPELYELRQEAKMSEQDASQNWFSVQSAFKVYRSYLDMDKDQNGMLSPQELGSFGSGMLTDVFIQRVFEECQTYDGEMDYKTFLDFVLAMENMNTPQSMAYMWRLIDFDRSGKLDAFKINYFFRAVVKVLEDKDLDPVSVLDVKDEIFDMVRPKDPNYIVLDDLVGSKIGGTVLSMLVDTYAFYNYDHREQNLLSQSEEDEEY